MEFQQEFFAMLVLLSEHPLPTGTAFGNHIHTYFGKCGLEAAPDEPFWRAAQPLPGSHLQQEGLGAPPSLPAQGICRIPWKVLQGQG